jgi:hypothetical protein
MNDNKTNPTKTYRARADYMLRELAGECVLIPTGEAAAAFNGIISLNNTSRFVWEALKEPLTFSELLARFLEEYEIDEDTAKADLQELLDDFAAHHMIEG